MGAETSRQPIQPIHSPQEILPFDQFPTELKISIFVLLPYRDVVNCILLNKSYAVLINDNWNQMRRDPVSDLRIRSEPGEPEEMFGLELTELMQTGQANLSFHFLRVEVSFLFSTMSVGAISGRAMLLTKVKVSRSPRKRLLNLRCIRCLRRTPSEAFPEHNFAINSIEDGAQQYIDYILSKMSPRCIWMYSEKNAKFQLSVLWPILMTSFMKHGIKLETLHVTETEINSTAVALFNWMGPLSLALHYCNFENDTILSQISNTNNLFISIQKMSSCELIMFRPFIENWMQGKYKKLKMLRLGLTPRQGEILYDQVLKGRFKHITNAPGQFREMVFTRSDGYKLSLIHDGENYLFRRTEKR